MMRTSKVERILLNLGFKCNTVESKVIDSDNSVSQNTLLGQRRKWMKIKLISKTLNTDVKS